jgi:hypothetical protein
LGDQKSDGESNCNAGDGTGQMAQPWLFMTMILIILEILCVLYFTISSDPESTSRPPAGPLPAVRSIITQQAVISIK